MLSTDFYTLTLLFVPVFAIGVTIGALVHARKCARYCESAANFMAENTKEAVSNSKTGELERSLTELWDSHASLLASHKRLRSKYGMRDLRERRNADERDSSGNGSLDLGTTTDKDALRAELRKSGQLK